MQGMRESSKFKGFKWLIDLYTVDTNCVNFSSPFELTVKKTGSLTAIVGYFDVFFDLDNPISFSTGPQSTPTHWKQTVFSLSEPISISEGKHSKSDNLLWEKSFFLIYRIKFSYTLLIFHFYRNFLIESLLLITYFSFFLGENNVQGCHRSSKSGKSQEK